MTSTNEDGAGRAARIASGALLLIAGVCALLMGLSLSCPTSPDGTGCSSSPFWSELSFVVEELTKNWSAVTALQAICLLVAVYGILTQKRGSRPSTILVTFVLGASPILAQMIANAWASSLGCYVTEHNTYSRSAPYDLPGCTMGHTDVGPIMHAMYMAALALLLTWPFIPISMAHGISWFRRRQRRE